MAGRPKLQILQMKFCAYTFFEKGISSYLAKMCKNRKCAKYDKFCSFVKSLKRQIEICKNSCNISKTKFYLRKIENCKFSLEHLCKYLCKISSQTSCILLPFVQVFPKSYTYMSKSNDWK